MYYKYDIPGSEFNHGGSFNPSFSGGKKKSHVLSGNPIYQKHTVHNVALTLHALTRKKVGGW